VEPPAGPVTAEDSPLVIQRSERPPPDPTAASRTSFSGHPRRRSSPTTSSSTVAPKPTHTPGVPTRRPPIFGQMAEQRIPSPASPRVTSGTTSTACTRRSRPRSYTWRRLRHFFDEMVTRHGGGAQPGRLGPRRALPVVEGKTPEIGVGPARTLLARHRHLPLGGPARPGRHRSP